MKKSKIDNEELTNQDLINRYLKDPESLPQLSVSKKRMIVRFQFAKGLLLSKPHWNQQEVIKSIMREFNVSYYVAFYDLKRAVTGIGYDYIDNKSYWRSYLIKECIKGIEMAMAKQDLKTHAEYIKRITDITGLRNEEIPQGDFGPKNLFLLIQGVQQNYYLQLDKLEENDPKVVESIQHDIIETQYTEIEKEIDDTIKSEPENNS